MAVALCEVGRRGRLQMQFANVRGKTILKDTYSEIPFKVTRLHDEKISGIAHVIVMQCTAGLFGGDTIECDILVEAGARVLITQQSATKVHPSPAFPAERTAAVQHTRVRVAAGGEAHI